MTEPHPALDEVVDDLGDEDEGALVIIEERSGPVTRRWVRFVMPVMVEVDCDDVAGPQWEYDHLRPGPPVNWPKSSEWEEGFDLTEADDEYAEVHPYADPRY